MHVNIGSIQSAVFNIYFLSSISWSTTGYSHSVFHDDYNDLVLKNPRNRRSPLELSQFGVHSIPANYSVHDAPPKENGNPSRLTLALLIMNVRGIKEIDEEITMELNMQIFWEDSRLSDFASQIKSDYIILKPTFLDKLWHPDIFIDHLKSVAQPMLMSKAASLRVYPNGVIRYSTRMTLTLACQMDFHYYPADTQKCMVDVKSYAYIDTELVLAWKEKQAASFSQPLNLPNFYVGMETPASFSLRTTSGSYSGLRFTILLTRKLSYHLIQTYLPSCLLVMVSWLSFLVPPDSVPGRMAICMTCLLTLIAMFASVRQSIPNVSYVKAIDIWMVVCVFFVFMALAEFCIVLKFLSIRRKEKKEESGLELEPIPEHQVINGQTNEPKLGPFQISQLVPLKSPVIHGERVKKIELYTSIILPIIFLGFNLVYWPWLMAYSQYYSQNSKETTVIFSSTP